MTFATLWWQAAAVTPNGCRDIRAGVVLHFAGGVDNSSDLIGPGLADGGCSRQLHCDIYDIVVADSLDNSQWLWRTQL